MSFVGPSLGSAAGGGMLQRVVGKHRDVVLRPARQVHSAYPYAFASFTIGHRRLFRELDCRSAKSSRSVAGHRRRGAIRTSTGVDVRRRRKQAGRVSSLVSR